MLSACPDVQVPEAGALAASGHVTTAPQWFSGAHSLMQFLHFPPVGAELFTDLSPFCVCLQAADGGSRDSPFGLSAPAVHR